MLYLLYGTENYLIKKEIDKILNANSIEKINVSEYNLEIDNFKDIIEDANTISLFADKKAIIVNNSYLFTGKSIKNENDPELFLDYFKNVNPDSIIIFIVDSEKLDERKKIVKEIKKIGTVKDFNQKNDLTDILKNMFEGYNISIQDIRFMIDRCGNNLDILSQEVNKIKIYKDEDKNITKEDIINLTSKNIDIDIFGFVDTIVNKNKNKALEIYKEMLINGEEPIKILVILANQFRIIYQAKELYKQGYSGNDIATMIGIHPYRIKLALKKAINYNSDTLLDYLEKLADLDYDIKIGNIESSLGLEMFILSI
jgi:DNA polymerase-3 subunit delta